MQKYLVGLDVGGTKVEASLIQVKDGIKKTSDLLNLSTKTHANLSLEILGTKRIQTQRNEGYLKVTQRISELINDLLSICKFNPNKLDAIGVGLPGSVHPVRQTMLNGNTGIFKGQNFGRDILTHLKLQIPVLCNNDASCFALAEALCGAGLKYRDSTDCPISQQVSIGIILGTGCGSGIITNGEILNGKNGGGGEVGHTVLYHDGVPCFCGQKGCVEQYLSGPGLEASHKKLHSLNLSSKEIFDLALQDDNQAIQTIDQYRSDLALFLTNLTNTFDPDYFVLGGGVSSQDLIYAGLEDMVYKNTFLNESRPRIYKHKLSDSSGVIGAAILTLD